MVRGEIAWQEPAPRATLHTRVKRYHPTTATSTTPRPSNTSASARHLPARSFAAITGSPASGQAMPSAGSFQSSVRSCCGAVGGLVQELRRVGEHQKPVGEAGRDPEQVAVLGR